MKKRIKSIIAASLSLVLVFSMTGHYADIGIMPHMPIF